MTAETATMSLIRTKLHRPPVAPDILPRARLLEQLNEGRQRPLSLICAPAGYGKSTLASRWLEVCDCPSAWLSLDESENDLRMFLNYLLYAIKTMFPDAVPTTQALVNASTLPPLPVLTGNLVNELDLIKQKFILALDDYQYIHERTVHDLFTELLRHPPQNIHLALLTRRDPPLPLSTLRARGQVAEVRAQDLRFTPAETAAYLEKLLGERIDESTAAAWTEKTEGWVSGLRLAAISMRHRGDVKSMLPERQGGAQYVMEYLFTEVLSDQPPRVRDYLLSTSILNRFCAPLCDALRGPDVELGPDEIDSWKFIALLKQENMFVISLDAENRWFRYHHLFQQLLRNQLKRHRSPEDIAALHSEASKWFEGQGLIEEAIHYALAAGDAVGAAYIVERHRHDALEADKYYLLDKWLAELPLEIKQQRPELLLARAWVSNHRLDLPAIPLILEDIERIPDRETLDTISRGEIDFFKGFISYFQSQGLQSEEFLRSALEQVPETYHCIRGEVELHYALALHMNGHKEMALGELDGWLHTKRLTREINRTRLWAGKSFIQLLEGNLPEALHSAQQVGDIARKGNILYAESWCSYLEALIDFFRNDLENAAQHFSQLLTNPYIMHTRAAIDSFCALTHIYMTTQQPDKAEETKKLLLEFARQTNDPTYNTIASSCHAHLSMLRGDMASAMRWQQTADLTPDAGIMLWWVEVPRITECRVLIAEASETSLQEAIDKLQKYEQENKAVHNTCQTIGILSLMALAYKKQERIDEGLTTLGQAIELAEPGGFIRPFLELGSPMADLLKRLIKKNVAVEYIDRLLAAFRDDEQVVVPDASVSQAIQEPPVSPQSLRPPVSASADVQPLVEPLTIRELDVLELLAQRMQNKEIAEKLCISPETVKAHLKNIFQKLMVSTRRQAITRAKTLGILSRL